MSGGRGHLLFGAFARALYGVLALALPKYLFPGGPGVSEAEIGPNGRYFNRLFGGRDILVALITLGQLRRGQAGAALRTNVACEVTDSVSLAQEVRARGGLDRVTIIGLLFNIAGYRAWLKAAGGIRQARRLAAAAASESSAE